MRRHLAFLSLPLIAAAVLALAPAGARAGAERPVDLELVLAIDASASVSYDEFNLQMAGLARAFRDPAVIRAIETGAPNGIAVSLIQWSGPNAQALGVDWTLVRDRESARAFAERIDATPRLVIGGGTAIGDAVMRAMRLFDGNGFAGARRVIDVSGDGAANQGAPPEIARAAAEAAGITINGLAIVNEEPDLDRYYEKMVIEGAASFVLVADDFADFARAIRLKLILEATGAPMAGNTPPPRATGAPHSSPIAAPLTG